jgi:sugar phosphate isomerase/epimerase
MKLSFTTLGCPQWNLDTIILRAAEYGYDAVDFRGVGVTLDITTLPEFTVHGAEVRQRFADAGLVISGISSSIQVCHAGKRTANLDEAQRTIAVAKGLGCPNVRIFGGGEVEKVGRGAAAAIGRECIAAILALDGAEGMRWLFETHDHWISSADCRLLLDAIPNPQFGALWDAGHTTRVGHELPAHTYATIGPRIGYTHFKDAVYDPSHSQAMKDGWRYVLPGTGQLPLAEAMRVLQEGGYDGYLVFEHEKRWHQNLPEPEVALPAFVQWARAIKQGWQTRSD